MHKIYQVTQAQVEAMSIEERRKYFKGLMELWSGEPELQAEYQKDWEEDKDGRYR